MRDAAFFLIWMVLFPISFWSAHIGVLLWIWTALIAPGELLYGFMASLPYNKLIAIITFGTLLFNQEKKRFYVDGTIVLLALLGLSATITNYTAIMPSHDGQFLYEKLLKILVLTFVVSGIMWSRWRIHASVLAICLAFGFDGMNDAGKYILSGGGHKIVGKHALGDNNHLALALLMTIPLLIYAYKQSSDRLARMAFLAVAAACVITVIGSHSRGGFIGLVVMAGMFMKNSKHKAASLSLIGLGAVLILALAPDSWLSRVDTINSAGDDNSFMGRVIAWKISALIALERPFGGGFHAVQLYPVWNHYAGSIDNVLSFIETGPAGMIPKAAHSIYFEVLGDLGVVGFSVFLALLIVGFRNASALKRYGRQDPRQQWAADLGGAVQISLVVYCVSGGAVSMGYFETFYVLLIILSRTRRSVQDAMAERVAPPASPIRTGRMLSPSRPADAGRDREVVLTPRRIRPGAA